ncbi:MAG: hypothetical protein QXG48_00555 [Thermofilaceae archaeon]
MDVFQKHLKEGILEESIWVSVPASEELHASYIRDNGSIRLKEYVILDEKKNVAVLGFSAYTHEWGGSRSYCVLKDLTPDETARLKRAIMSLSDFSDFERLREFFRARAHRCTRKWE